MNKFNWEDFLNERISVNCNTKEKALDFLAKCEAQGINWHSGESATRLNYWEHNREETTYCFQLGGMAFSDIKTDVEDDMIIVKWEIKNN